jgi:peptidoglycan/LPS O-acetylase OafA/YrhL
VSTRVHLTLAVGADGTGQWMLRQLLYGATALFLILPAVFGPQDEGFVRRFLRSRSMVAIGLVSYGVYLWHEGVLDLWLRARDLTLFNSALPPLLLVAVVGTGAAATLSYVLVERPALARK